MEILNTPTTNTPVSSSATQTETATAITSDFDTFLQMLTAQARYQDPLEPIDSSEYAAQLAQFSMVEQQVLSNDLLTGLTTQMGDSSFGQFAGWIGMEARTAAPVPFDGTPLTVLPRTETGADEAYLVVYDDSGAEVQRQQISTDASSVEWAGVSDSGAVLPSGTCRFEVESIAVGESLGMQPAETYTPITEARRQGADTVFVISGGSIITAGEVTALRQSTLDGSI